jgi:hypothetical protein
MMSLKVIRIAAVLLSVGTFVFLFPAGSWRTDNIFLIPDLALCAALLIAAALPARLAVPGILAAASFAAGVLVTAVVSSTVDGRIGVGSLIGAAGSLVIAVLLLRHMAAKPV